MYNSNLHAMPSLPPSSDSHEAVPPLEDAWIRYDPEMWVVGLARFERGQTHHERPYRNDRVLHCPAHQAEKGRSGRVPDKPRQNFQIPPDLVVNL
jgi:hypothetical protein